MNANLAFKAKAAQRVLFGDVVRHVKDKVDPVTSRLTRYVAGEHMDSDDLRIRRWGEINSNYLGPAFHMRFKPGQVLYGSRRTYLRKVAVPDFTGVCANTTFVLEPKDPSVLLPEFLPFLMQTEAFHTHSIKQSKGSVNPYVNFSDLAWWEFVLPSLQEQRTLASAMSAVWECIAANDDARVAGERARQAMIFFLYEGRACRGRRRTTPIGQLPASWEVAPLGERYEVQLGKMISETARGGSDQTVYLRNANVQWNRFDLDDVATMSFSPKEREKFSLRYGDIVACEGRHVGKSALWRDEIPGACYQKALHRIRRHSDRDIPEYMLHCFKYYSWVGRFAAETGETTIPHLPAERLRSMLFPYPPPDQQRDVAARIATFDSTLRTMESRAKSSRSLFKVLHSSLEGR